MSWCESLLVTVVEVVAVPVAQMLVGFIGGKGIYTSGDVAY